MVVGRARLDGLPIEYPRIPRIVDDPAPPRLLVTLRPREGTPRAIREKLPGVTWAYGTESEPSRWSQVEAMLVGALDRELPGYSAGSTPRLAFVQRVYTGVDGFPFDRFPASVKVAGNVGAFAPYVAEQAIALALAAARSILSGHAQVRAGRLRPAPENRLLYRSTAVILGFGEIGRAIAARLRGFEVRVVGVNRSGRMAPGADAMYPADELKSAVAGADLVFDVRPLTRATRGSIDASVLAAMGPRTILVNVGRGATVDEEALYRHLQAHPEFRAGLDVWWDEDYAAGTLGSRFPFADLPNFVGSPHVAGLGPGVEDRVLARALENLARYFRGEPPRFVVDPAEYRD